MTNCNLNYSILMSVYRKDKPDFLMQSIESMLNQTIKSNDFIIVKDGELTKELEDVLNQYSTNNKEITIVSLEQNSGLGKALDYGLSFCKNELVARMDADDISLPQRCEKLLQLFNDNPDLSIAGANIDEFINNPNNPVSSRVVPTSDKEIKKYIRRRSPFNHPTVMFKKSEVVRCGGYGPLKRKQDMDLFSRMMNMGCTAQNIPESLLLFRADEGNLKRRQSKEYRKNTIEVAKLNLKRKYINIFDFLYIAFGQFLMSILPKSLLNKLLRKSIKEEKKKQTSNSLFTIAVLALTTSFIFVSSYFGINNSSICSLERWCHSLQSQSGSNIHIRYYLAEESEGKRKSIIEPVNSFNGYRTKELGRSVSFVNEKAFTISFKGNITTASSTVYGDYYNERFTTSRLALINGTFNEEDFSKGNYVYLSQNLFNELSHYSSEDFIGQKVILSFDTTREFIVGGSIGFNGLNDLGVHIRHYFGGSFILISSLNVYDYDFTDLVFGSDDYHFADDLLEFENKINNSYLNNQKIKMRTGSVAGTDLIMSDIFLLNGLTSNKKVLFSILSIFVIAVSLIFELIVFIKFKPNEKSLVSKLIFTIGVILLGFTPILLGLLLMKSGLFMSRVAISIIIIHAALLLFFDIVKSPFFSKENTLEVEDANNE